MELKNTVVLDLEYYEKMKQRSEAMDKLESNPNAFVVMYRDYYFYSLRYQYSGDDIIEMLKKTLASSEKERKELLDKNHELEKQLDKYYEFKWWQFWKIPTLKKVV